MFNPFVVSVDLQHQQRAAQSFPGMQGIWKGLLDRMPPFEYHESTPETSCCCLGLSRKGALPKPSSWGSPSVAVRDRQSCRPGYQSCSPSTADRWVALPAGTSRTVVCQARCLGQVSQMLYPETGCTEQALHREPHCCAAAAPLGPSVTHKS